MDHSSILILDDGELSPVARLLDEYGLTYTRVRGGGSTELLSPPSELLIATPRRAGQVRRGSPRGAPAGRPIRIIAVQEDSPSMRRGLRRSGFHLLVRLPCDDRIWRLMIRRALYHGEERRIARRVTVGAEVHIGRPGEERASEGATLIDLSNRGARLSAREPFELNSTVEIHIPETLTEDQALHLQANVARLGTEGTEFSASVMFDYAMPEDTRLRLTHLINRWSTGPPSETAGSSANPPLPAARIRSLPGIVLDDEIDPPIDIGHAIQFRVSRRPDQGDRRMEQSAEDRRSGQDRRDGQRGLFTGPVVAEGDPDNRQVLIGRDLSAGGMRIEPSNRISVGDHFRLALYGAGAGEPFEVSAKVIRDDGEEGLALAFQGVSLEISTALEKLVAGLPDIESLEAGEPHGMGAILSEILDAQRAVG